MRPLHVILASGAGIAFAVSLLVFWSAFSEHRAQGCLQVEASSANPACADALTTMQASGLVAIAMIGVLYVLLRLAGQRDA